MPTASTYSRQVELPENVNIHLDITNCYLSYMCDEWYGEEYIYVWYFDSVSHNINLQVTFDSSTYKT